MPECPGIEIFFNDDTCDDWCDDLTPLQLVGLSRSSCDDLNDLILTNAPQIASFCSDEDIPDECDAICEDFGECGFEVERDGCVRFCRGYEPEVFECAVNANACFELFDCVDEMEPEDNINYDEVCDGACFREFQCIRNVCAPGTLEIDAAFGDGYFESCKRECLQTRPPVEELVTIFDGMCPDVVSQIRMENEEIDQRCDNEVDEICSLQCEKVVACGAVTQEECLQQCSGWGPENTLCIDNTPREQCERLNGCFGDESGAENCRNTCAHLHECLLQACPPQLIPPRQELDCVAGCLPEPPSDRITEEYVALQCRAVRGFVYNDSPEIRGVCEGGQDFRPTAEECVDLCSDTLDECVPGGRQQCIGLCRSLSREQYACALVEGATCESIDTCFNEQDL